MYKLGLLGWLGLPAVALAVDVDPVDPSGSIPHNSGTPVVESPALTNGGLSAGVMAHVSEDLITRTAADGSLVRSVPHVFATNLYGGWTFQDRLRIEVMAPVYWHTRNSTGSEPFAGAALGDLVVQSNIRIVENESGSFGLSVIPTLGLPTGNKKALVARGTHLKLRGAVGGLIADRVGYAANAGFTVQRGREFLDLAVGSSVGLAGGSWVMLNDNMRVGADLDLSIGTSNAPGARNTLGTSHLFAQATNDRGLGLTVGVGKGFLVGAGAPKYKVFAALTWAQIVRDADNDGIPDKVDACPLDPEDYDQFEDIDGCPEEDNDSDGILDVDDDCPNDAEDFDAWEDVDGCPDPDNDADGILDENDACMYRAGDLAMAGCPDSDGDGLPDDSPAADWSGWEAVVAGGYEGSVPLNADQCPLDPGPAALIGCPDTDLDDVPNYRDACPDLPKAADEPADRSSGCPSKAFVSGDRIQITEKVQFETGKSVIRSESFSLLDSVVDALRNYPQITSVEVAGHTDNVGSDSFNLRLSKRRAAAVMSYLTKKGVSAERIASQGYGEIEPVGSNFTDSGRAQNRRVEFRILSGEAFSEEVETNLGADVAGLSVLLPQERPFAVLEVDGKVMSPRAPVRSLIVEPGERVIRVRDARRGLDYTETMTFEAGSTETLRVPDDSFGDPDASWLPSALPEGIPLDLPAPADGAVPVDDAVPADDAPLAVPEAGTPDDIAVPAATPPAGAPNTLGTPDDTAVDDASLLPTADTVSGDLDDPWGTAGATPAPTTAPEPDPKPAATSDDDIIEVLEPPAAGGESGPGFGQPDDAASGPGFGDPAVENGPGFGQDAAGTVTGPGFGDQVEVSAAELRRQAKAEAKASKKAAKAAVKSNKKSKNEAPPPLVDPTTLTPDGGSSQDPASTEPAPPAEPQPAPDDDPWSVGD